MSLSIEQIKIIIAEQKSKWNMVSIIDFNSRQQCREAIENDFLSENDITDQADEFCEDVDYDEVSNLRTDAMLEVLTRLDVENADDYEDAISGLEFSHFCGGCSYNNVNLEAYLLDKSQYKIVRYVSQANGDRDGNVDTLDISIEAYDKLENDPYNNLVRFQAVNELFHEQ